MKKIMMKLEIIWFVIFAEKIFLQVILDDVMMRKK